MEPVLVIPSTNWWLCQGRERAMTQGVFPKWNRPKWKLSGKKTLKLHLSLHISFRLLKNNQPILCSQVWGISQYNWSYSATTKFCSTNDFKLCVFIEQNYTTIYGIVHSHYFLSMYNIEYENKIQNFWLEKHQILKFPLAGPCLNFTFSLSGVSKLCHFTSLYVYVSTSPSMLCYEPSPRMSQDWLLLLTSVKTRTSDQQSNTHLLLF